jgi:hypothetical protein
MSKFKTAEDITAYPVVMFYPRPYQVSFGLEYNATPLIPHVSMRVAPSDVQVSFTLRDAKRLRDWLTTYINDRKGILR